MRPTRVIVSGALLIAAVFSGLLAWAVWSFGQSEPWREGDNDGLHLMLVGLGFAALAVGFAVAFVMAAWGRRIVREARREGAALGAMRAQQRRSRPS